MFNKFNSIFFIAVLFLAVSCGKKTQEVATDQATNTENTTKEGTTPVVVPVPEPEAGGSFNKFFPKSEGEFEVVFTQEKEGFAQAKLKKGGNEVATLTVSDAIKNADAITDYASSTKKIGEFPAVAKGALGTAILLNNRFQVQVRSKDKTFADTDREMWLQKFNLSGIANLK